MTMQHPWMLAIAVLAAVPWFLFKAQTIFLFSSFLVLPGGGMAGRWSYVLRAAMSIVIIAYAFGFAGITILLISAGEDIEEGSQIVLLRDGSSSMDQALGGYDYKQPNKPSKRVIATHIIERFIQARDGHDQFGLIEFGSSTVTRAPLDFDKERLLAILRSFTPNLQMTVIGDAIERAIHMLPRHEWGGTRAIILVSDGDGEINNLDNLERWMKQWHISFWWVFIGSKDEWERAKKTHELVARLGTQARLYQGEKKEELDAAMADIRTFQRGIIRVPHAGAEYRMDKIFYGISYAFLSLIGLAVAAEYAVMPKREHGSGR